MCINHGDLCTIWDLGNIFSTYFTPSTRFYTPLLMGHLLFGLKKIAFTTHTTCMLNCLAEKNGSTGYLPLHLWICERGAPWQTMRPDLWCCSWCMPCPRPWQQGLSHSFNPVTFKSSYWMLSWEKPLSPFTLLVWTWSLTLCWGHIMSSQVEF